MIVDIDAGNTRIKWRASLGDHIVDGGIEQVTERPLASIHAALVNKGDTNRVRLLSVRSPYRYSGAGRGGQVAVVC